MSKSKPTVTLVGSPSFHGQPSLDALKLLFKGEQPAVYYSVSWEGAYHHTDGSSGYTVIPPEMLPDLTAETLADWLVKHFGSIPDTEFLSSYAHDARVIAWCNKVRQICSLRAMGVRAPKIR